MALLGQLRAWLEGGSADRFDATSYWRHRIARHPGLVGTGTSFMPEAWQRSLYQAKERAYAALLGRQGVALAGARVLDFGCGTGYFEDVWAGEGAAHLAGIDVVEGSIERLARAHPDRRYLCVDLAETPEGARALGEFDLVTAIDVLYHVVDDAALARVIGALAERMAPGGWLLFTDALRDARPAPHVRFRSAERWASVLGAHGLAVVDREPVAVLHNRRTLIGKLAPATTGAVQLRADATLRRVTPWLANNWAVLASRRGR